MAPIQIKFSFRYGSHMPVLLQALLRTRGDILEMGAGIFSTPMIHAFTVAQRRNALTLENYPRWQRWFSIYENQYHKVKFINSWNDAEVEKPWDVVLVDQTPDHERHLAIKKLSKLARYIVIHDANLGGNADRQYKYSKVFPLFKYRFDYRDSEPNTTVLSNLVDLRDFWV